MPAVDYSEETGIITIKVGRFLIEKSYFLASTTGMRIDSISESDSLGVLEPRLTHPTWKGPRASLLSLQRKPRRAHVATLWFENDFRGAHEGHWVFEVFGRQQVEKMKELAEEISKKFSVNIDLRLVKETENWETFLGDYDI